VELPTMKVLVFDIWADYAHFRKFYTTTSPLTFSFPPPPTIAGILGAIYGTDKNTNKYLEIFGCKECRVSIRILNPIKKVRMGLNFITTKDNCWQPILKITSKSRHEPRTQIRTEFLKDPKFRIYVGHENKNIFEELVKRIRDREIFYTVSLGLSELIANFSFIGVYICEQKFGDTWVDIHSVFPITNLSENGLIIEEGKKYFKEKIPIIMKQNRMVEKYEDVIFEPDGKTIKAKLKTYFKLENGENIVFF
jgi:CRISPR-associated protein Cas5h